MKGSGIYRWVVRRAGKPDRFYVGQAVNIHVRRLDHLRELKAVIHKNPALQRAFDAHGEEAFIFEVLETCEKPSLTEREQHWMDRHRALYGASRIYNVLINCVNSRAGIPCSEETRAKIGAAQKGRKLKPEQIEGMRQRATGRKLSAESIAKRTAKQKGRKHSSEEIARRVAARRPYSWSPEGRARISATKKASGWQPSAEHMEKLRLANTGRKLSLQARVAIARAASERIRLPDAAARGWATRHMHSLIWGPA